jgi:large subunit ribosomal protein L22
MQVKAEANYLRIAPRKVRLVADLLRGLDAGEALLKVGFINKGASQPLKKLLASAIANAENNFKLDKNNLYISAITVDDGPTLKRWLPRAFGRATQLQKRSSQVNLTLSEKVASKPLADKKAKADKTKKDLEILAAKPKDQAEIGDGEEGGDSKKEIKKQTKGFTKKLFNRKSG